MSTLGEVEGRAGRPCKISRCTENKISSPPPLSQACQSHIPQQSWDIWDCSVLLATLSMAPKTVFNATNYRL
jgi:hypothetical protein